MSPAREAILRKRQPEPEEDFRDALIAGLTAMPKYIPSKYFYDEAGSELFEQICALPEYYPTRTELGLLRRHANEIAALFGPDAEIVEFGAGAIEKIRPLLDVAERPRAYIPVDISGAYLRSVAAKLDAEYPELTVRPVVADFTGTLPDAIFSGGARRIGFFPGSTIGNFEDEEAAHFLSETARLVKGGGLLIGVDLVKDPTILHAAYNDDVGVTAAFNKNLLVRANRELGTNFDLQRFAHYACYNPVRQRIEMYLVSLVAQRVTIAGRAIRFAEGEAIHTEWSHKYTVEGFRALAASAGFNPRAAWCDPQRLFSIHWLESV